MLNFYQKIKQQWARESGVFDEIIRKSLCYYANVENPIAGLTEFLEVAN